MSAAPLGISGRTARFFLTNQLTPLLALAGMLLGLFAVLVTPREEEPQIDVTMANVIVPFPGASAAEVESLITEPMEQVLAEISDVKHLYSVSRPGAAILTVEFEVGVPRNTAIVRLYNAIFSNLDMPPPNLGWLQPIIKPKGIDDVPVVTVTLWTRDPERGSYDLAKIAHALEGELKRVHGARNVYTIGGPDDVVHVELDPQRLAENYTPPSSPGFDPDALLLATPSALHAELLLPAIAAAGLSFYIPIPSRRLDPGQLCRSCTEYGLQGIRHRLRLADRSRNLHTHRRSNHRKCRRRAYGPRR